MLRAIYDKEGEIGLLKHKLKLEHERRNQWENLNSSQKGIRVFKWIAISLTCVTVTCAIGA